MVGEGAWGGGGGGDGVSGPSMVKQTCAQVSSRSLRILGLVARFLNECKDGGLYKDRRSPPYNLI